jgi:voltage-gated potassium channel
MAVGDQPEASWCAMKLLLRPFRLLYQLLVWLANSPRKLMMAYLLLIVSSGAIYSVTEHKSVGDSVWWAVVTASTVGYGDTYPTTWAGRVLAGLLISTMVLLVIPLITAHFASRLIVDADAFRHEEQEEIKQNLRAIRAMMEDLTAGSAAPPGGPSDR